ncbi:MAG TPA: MaoC/PaaZ C-terminal domain-containing protein [Solirubrobacterales bacterium]|nr:MaoC/PaaZ C-terminal domain-containing protein [Solirubrobacterales bacterium]
MSTHARLVCSRGFEDMRPGERFQTHGRTIGEFDLSAFGALTGDCAPQHLDRAFAEGGPFGERIAHGALVLSYALGLVPIDPERLIALRALRDVKFKQSVHIGDTIHVEVDIGTCKPVSDDSGLVELVSRVLNDRGQAVALMKMDVLWRRTPGA